MLLLCVVLIALALALAACGSTPKYNSGDTGTGGTGDGTTQGDQGSGPSGGMQGGSSPGSGMPGSGSGMMNNVIVARDFTFTPATLEVSVGETVTWSNADQAAHDVEIDGQNLGRMSQGEALTWKAEKAGTYPYACTIHPSMTGTVVVK
jgi:plastocyanin